MLVFDLYEQLLIVKISRTKIGVLSNKVFSPSIFIFSINHQAFDCIYTTLSIVFPLSKNTHRAYNPWQVNRRLNDPKAVKIMCNFRIKGLLSQYCKSNTKI